MISPAALYMCVMRFIRRESVADVVTIDLSPVTGVCLKHLHAELHKYHHRKLKIGAFCVVSSVTGELNWHCLILYYNNSNIRHGNSCERYRYFYAHVWRLGCV